MRENLTRSVFDHTASKYDQDRSRLIPCYDRFYSAALNLVPATAESVVDLGAGSGLFTEFLRRKLPTAHIHLMDFSAPMLELAHQRLGTSQATAKLTYELADYMRAPYPSNQDAIVSSLSIHHLEDDVKQQLFHKIYAALRPGGIFVNADHIAGPTPELELEYQTRWLAEICACGATEQQIADSLYRQQEDRRSTVGDQLAWIAAAGFSAVDCWFKDGSFAVFCGMRGE